MISAISIILALFAILISAFAAYNLKKMSERKKEYEKERSRRLTEISSTDFLDETELDETCEICFGPFEEGDVSVCGCGKKFHKECVTITEECPYCHERPENMTVRPISRPVCCACGRTLTGSICRCGAINRQKDGTFTCECGETVIAKVIGREGKCPKCGLKYGLTYDRPGKPI